MVVPEEKRRPFNGIGLSIIRAKHKDGSKDYFEMDYSFASWK